MSDVTIEEDKESFGAFEHNIKELVKITGKPVEEILKQQGRLLAVGAAKYTERYGDKASVGADHKKEITKTIQSTYKPASGAKGMAGWVQKYRSGWLSKEFNKAARQKDAKKLEELSKKFKLGNAYRGRQIKFIPWDGGAAHTRRLKRSGDNRLFIVMGPAKDINQYITKKKKQVGAAKHGWAKAAIMLGHKGTGRGMPQYFAKWRNDVRGFGKVKGKGSKSELTVANYHKYGFSKTSLAGVFRSRTNAINKDIKQLMKRGHGMASQAKPVKFARKKLIRTA